MLKPIRLIVTGPRFMDDRDLVFDTLDEFTDNRSNVVLISDCRPEYQTWQPDHSNFPIACDWFTRRWRMNAVRDGDKTKFSTTIPVFEDKVPKKGDQEKSAKRRRRTMMERANALVAFHEVGGDDHETRKLVKLAVAFNLILKVVRT